MIRAQLLGKLALIVAPLLLGATRPAMPHYDHIFVIVDENKRFGQIVGGAAAPNINAWAKTFGLATHYDAVAHPSEPNYIAIVGGDTFGVHDDGAHSIDAPNLSTQLDAAHLTWKGYYQGIPAPGSLVPYAGLYAAKHSGFAQFANVRNSLQRAEHLVGFDAFARDAASNVLPNFALIIPDLCDDMHGALGFGIPGNCEVFRRSQLIARGDGAVKNIVDVLMRSAAWKGGENVAIVLTFDEDDGGGSEGGGGRVPTIVITNHGPRHFIDTTPYTHYSLLRTIEENFGLARLGHAADAATASMAPLFR